MGKYDPSLMRLFFYFFSYSFSPVFAESALLRALWFVFRNLSGCPSDLLLFRLSLFFRLLFSYGFLPFSVLIRACEYYNVSVFLYKENYRIYLFIVFDFVLVLNGSFVF